MTTTLTAGRKRILRELDVGMFIPNAYISALAAGSFTSPSFFQDPVMAPDFLQVRNTGVVRGGAATSADFWRPAGTITIGTGVVAIAPNWADSTLGTEDIELWYHRVRPDQEVLDSLNRVLIKEFVTSFFMLSHGSRYDYGMDLQSTDGNWTDVGTPTTSAKTAGSAPQFIPYGLRAYELVGDAVNEGTRSAAMRVTQGGTVSAYAIVAAETGTASFQLYDSTNSATIGTAVTHSERRAMLAVIRNQELPATCKAVQLNMLGTTNPSDIYWNMVGLYLHNSNLMQLPGLVSESFMAPRIYQGIPRETVDTDVYEAGSLDFRPLTEGIDYWLVINQADAQPYKVRFADTSYYEYPLFVEVRVPQSSLVTMSAESDSFWDLNKVIPRWKKDLLETVYATGARRHPDWERQYNLAQLQLTEAGKARQKESIAPAREQWRPMLNA